jgi:hypothetical protein
MRLSLKSGLGKVRKLAITAAATAARPITAFLHGWHYQGRHRRGRNGTTVRDDTIRLTPIRSANVRLWPPAY